MIVFLTASPLLVSGIENSTKNSTDMITFTCIFSGFPKPDIIWYRHGNNGITDTLRTTIGELNITNVSTIDDGHYVVQSHLTIFDLERMDEGYYECRAIDSVFGSDNSSLAYLTVQGKCLLIIYIIIINIYV